jgi:hypothetical protein
MDDGGQMMISLDCLSGMKGFYTGLFSPAVTIVNSDGVQLCEHFGNPRLPTRTGRSSCRSEYFAGRD